MQHLENYVVNLVQETTILRFESKLDSFELLDFFIPYYQGSVWLNHK